MNVDLNERILVKRSINQYKLVGPGLVWIKPWEQILVKFRTDPQFYASHVSEVRTVDNIPVDIDVQVLYQVNLNLLKDDLLPRIQAEREALDTLGRVVALKQYIEAFGGDLAELMPFVSQWELLSTLRHKDGTQYLLTGSPLSPDPSAAPPPAYQLQLPLLHERE